MDGQVLGGGVVVLVAAALWLAYLLPSWHSRHQFNATERNAVRLSQALRILAETSDQPDEIYVELQTRSAHRQSKLARRAESERQKLEESAAQAEAERMREEAEYEQELLRTQTLQAREQRRAEIVAERTLAKVRSEADRARARADAAAEHERLRGELDEARNAPAVVAARQAYARRVVRLVALGLTVASIGLVVWGVIASSVLLSVAGVITTMLGIVMMQRMAKVSRRASRLAVVEEVAEVARVRVSVLHDEPAPKWTPRSLPQPLTTVAGSRAAAEQDAREAREALRRAALEEASRQKAAEQAPIHIDTVRPATLRPSMGDEEIEAHVRQLLASRAAS